MTISRLSLVALLAAALSTSLPVSAIARYHAIPLEFNTPNTKENSLSLNYQVFNARDCRKYLGRPKLLTKGYQPIQVTLTNSSNRSIKFSPKNFSIPTIDCDQVIESISFSTSTRIAAWGIPGLFIWPLLIPAVIEAFESPKANIQLEKDILAKCLREQIIAPFQTINGVIFVSKKQYNPSFSLTVYDVSTNEAFTLSGKNSMIELNQNQKI